MVKPRYLKSIRVKRHPKFVFSVKDLSFEIMDRLTVKKSVEIIEFHYEKGDFDVSTFWALQAFGFLLMRL